MSQHPARALTPLSRRQDALRADAERGYTEVHLLAAALQEHIEDLRHERDRLLSQVAAMRDDARRESAGWLQRGMKGNR